MPKSVDRPAPISAKKAERRQAGDDQRKEGREAESIEQARQQIAAAVIGAEPVLAVRTRRTRAGREVIDGRVVVMIRGVQREVARLPELRAHEWVQVIARRR